MSAIILDNELVHYEVLGRGRPVIFLHGWVGSWRYWIPAMQAASIDFRAYAIDLWGFGGTAKASNRYLLSSQRDLLDDFLNEMGIGILLVEQNAIQALKISQRAYVIESGEIVSEGSSAEFAQSEVIKSYVGL